MEGNEKADMVVKEIAAGQKIQTSKWTSIIHLKRQITEEKKAQLFA